MITVAIAFCFKAAVEVPQYVGVNLLVEGCRIECSCPIPLLRPSNCSGPKPYGTNKEKETAAEKVKPLPKTFKRADMLLKTMSSRVPHPPQPPVPIHIETFTLHLPMTVNRSIHLPVISHSHSVSLKKRLEVSKTSKVKVKLCTTEKHQGQPLPLEFTTLEQVKEGAMGTISKQTNKKSHWPNRSHAPPAWTYICQGGVRTIS